MKELKEFPKVSRAGRTPKHPYDEWFAKAAEGNGIQLEQGEDFDSEVRTMRHNLYRVANSRGLEYETVTLKNDEGEEFAIALKILKPTTDTNKSATTKKSTTSKK